MSASRQNQSKAVLSEVQTRHTDIKHIEKTIIELHQLFMDMQMMIEQQGEVLNNVEQHADTTAVQLKEGNTSLTRAIAIAKSTRAVSFFFIKKKKDFTDVFVEKMVLLLFMYWYLYYDCYIGLVVWI